MLSEIVFKTDVASELGIGEAIVLQRLYSWHEKYGMNTWLHNSYYGWQAQFPFWSISRLRRIFDSLLNRGLIESRKTLFCNCYKICFSAANPMHFVSGMPLVGELEYMNN